MSRFDFKQFSIQQENCAMKVSSDACTFGAYVPVDGAKSILDIGSGTGLLSIMLAQRSEAKITGIEINELATIESKMNVLNSPFKDQISIEHTAIQDYQNEEGFDLIICNPPFFENYTKNKKVDRMNVRHTDQLKFKELLLHTERLLKPDGVAWFLLPIASLMPFIQHLGNDLFLTHQFSFRAKPLSNPAKDRVIIKIQKSRATLEKSYMHIKDKNGEYNKKYVEILAPYYLFL